MWHLERATGDLASDLLIGPNPSAMGAVPRIDDGDTLIPMGILSETTCGKCLEYLMPVQRYWTLREACASVGIEHNKSTDQMMFEYIRAFHDRGHQE